MTPEITNLQLRRMACFGTCGDAPAGWMAVQRDDNPDHPLWPEDATHPFESDEDAARWITETSGTCAMLQGPDGRLAPLPADDAPRSAWPDWWTGDDGNAFWGDDLAIIVPVLALKHPDVGMLAEDACDVCGDESGNGCLWCDR